jgi:nitrile hydratase accessory protein
VSDRELPDSGPAAPPRANGELVFEQPWESRAFGMAVSLREQGLFSWDEFREQLIAEIVTAEAGYRYYDRWLAALEKLLSEKGVCPKADLDERASAYAARPHGHDHQAGVSD